MSKNTPTPPSTRKSSRALWVPLVLAAITLIATAICAAVATSAAFVVLVIGAIVTVVVSILYGSF